MFIHPNKGSQTRDPEAAETIGVGHLHEALAYRGDEVKPSKQIVAS